MEMKSKRIEVIIDGEPKGEGQQNFTLQNFQFAEPSRICVIGENQF